MHPCTLLFQNKLFENVKKRFEMLKTLARQIFGHRFMSYAQTDRKLVVNHAGGFIPARASV